MHIKIIISNLDRIKIKMELLLKKNPKNRIAGFILKIVNKMLLLPQDHNTFLTDVNDNEKLNKNELTDRKLSLQSTPTMLEIGTTSICNIMPPCVQCPKHIDPKLGFINNNAYHIPKDYVIRSAPFVSRTKQLILHGVGEPLTCPYLFDSLNHAYYKETHTNFSTNGLLLNKTNIDKILSHRITSVNFSLDAASPETYKKIRHNDFHKVIGNIKNLINERDKRNLKNPEILINMTLMRENIAEVPEFIKLAKSLNADVQLFRLIKGLLYKFDWFDYADQHCENDPETHDFYINEGFEIAKKLGVKIFFTGKRTLCSDNSEYMHNSVKVDEKLFFCEFPWTHLLIDTDGSVYNCCWQIQPIGNLKKSSLWELWNGKIIKAIRKSTRDGIPHKICNHGGPSCPFVQSYMRVNAPLT